MVHPLWTTTTITNKTFKLAEVNEGLITKLAPRKAIKRINQNFKLIFSFCIRIEKIYIKKGVVAISVEKIFKGTVFKE